MPSAAEYRDTIIPEVFDTRSLPPSAANMSFSVTRTSSSFVVPSEPTPTDTLLLSAIDRVAGLRHMVPSLHVFSHGDEPAKVIRAALSKALVHYYPFAGRLVDDAHHGEVRLACTGEGAWFVHAKANCSLEDVEFLDPPHLISNGELLPQLSPEFDPLNLPLMMQVTEFTCGGFVIGLASSHVISDGLGAAQFMNAIGELARGLPEPTVAPVWYRELIPCPPRLVPPEPPSLQFFNLQQTTIDVSEVLINQAKSTYLGHTGQRCSTFDVVVAKLWQSRTRAIALDPAADVHVCIFANVRHLLRGVLPAAGGFYGNCFYPLIATSRSGRLSAAELVEIVSIIRDAKNRLPGEFARWAKGECEFYEPGGTYATVFVSDWSRVGILEVDFGWGKPLHMFRTSFFDFMPMAIIGAPPVPKTGARIMTNCVKKKHIEALLGEMKSTAQ